MDHFYCSFYWSKTTRSGTTFTRRENTTAFITPMNLQRLMYSAIVPSCKNQDGGVYLVSLKNQTEEKYRYTLCNGFGREIIGQLKYSKRLFPHASVNGIFTSDFWIGLNALSERTQNTDLVINFKQSKDILGGMHLVAIYKNVTVGRETDSWVFRGIFSPDTSTVGNMIDQVAFNNERGWWIKGSHQKPNISQFVSQDECSFDGMGTLNTQLPFYWKFQTGEYFCVETVQIRI